MNTVAVVIALVVVATLTSGFVNNNYRRYPSSLRNSWNSIEGRRARLINSGYLSVGQPSVSRRHKRAAVGYGSYQRNIGGHYARGGIVNNRLGGLRSGWGSNSRYNQIGY